MRSIKSSIREIVLETISFVFHDFDHEFSCRYVLYETDFDYKMLILGNVPESNFMMDEALLFVFKLLFHYKCSLVSTICICNIQKFKRHVTNNFVLLS